MIDGLWGVGDGVSKFPSSPVPQFQIPWTPMTPSCHRTDIAVYVITASRAAITELSRSRSGSQPIRYDMIAALASVEPQLVIIFYLIFITCETCRKVKRSAWGVASTPRSTPHFPLPIVSYPSPGMLFIGFHLHLGLPPPFPIANDFRKLPELKTNILRNLLNELFPNFTVY